MHTFDLFGTNEQGLFEQGRGLVSVPVCKYWKVGDADSGLELSR